MCRSGRSREKKERGNVKTRKKNEGTSRQPPHFPFSDTLTPPSRTRSLTSPSSSDTPPPWTPEPGHLHLETSLLLMMFLFGHWRLRSEDVTFNGTMTTPTSPKTDSCWSRDPTVSHSSDVPSLDPPRYHVMWSGKYTNNRAPDVSSRVNQSDYFLWSGRSHSASDTTRESIYVSEPKRLRSSSGHGGG
jgi:hypothetical protein